MGVSLYPTLRQHCMSVQYDPSMLWDVVRSRDEGKLIPNWQWGRLAAHRGRILVEQRHLQMLHRSSMVATLIQPTKPLPDLWDAHLVKLTENYMVFAGYERVIDALELIHDYAQTWVVRPATDDQPGHGPGGIV